jgi:hypothetical protein
MGIVLASGLLLLLLTLRAGAEEALEASSYPDDAPSAPAGPPATGAAPGSEGALKGSADGGPRR